MTERPSFDTGPLWQLLSNTRSFQILYFVGSEELQED